MTRYAPALFSTGFLSGMLLYRDHYPGNELDTCIVLPVNIQGFQTIHAIVDTGAPWCIFDPEILNWPLNNQPMYLFERNLMIRGIIYRGRLFRMVLSLKADYGTNLDVEASVFIPLLTPGEAWMLPNFIGLEGFLNRVRFAVDPTENAFYFGPV